MYLLSVQRCNVKEEGAQIQNLELQEHKPDLGGSYEVYEGEVIPHHWSFDREVDLPVARARERISDKHMRFGFFSLYLDPNTITSTSTPGYPFHSNRLKHIGSTFILYSL